MIVIDTRLAPQTLTNAVGSGRVSEMSSPYAYLLQAQVHMNLVFDVRKEPGLVLPRDFSLERWTSTEIAVADTIGWLIAYLAKTGCTSIEQLLRDVTAYRARYPDRPQGQWPYDTRKTMV